MNPNPLLPPRNCKNAFCFRSFTPTRRNHLYCSLKCKSVHNNGNATQRRASMKSGLKLLQANYTILSRLHHMYGNQSLDQQLLKLMDFNTNFFTGIKKLGDKTVYLLFDLGYEIDSANTFKIRNYA